MSRRPPPTREEGARRDGLLVAGTGLALLHHGPALALRAVGVDEPGVERESGRGTAELLDLEPLDPRVLGDAEHALQPLRRAGLADREVLPDRHDPAGLG